MPVLNVQMMRPHPAQAEIVNSPARFRVLACGRRFGKTEVDISELGHRAIKGQQVAYFAPSYKMTQETWRQIMWRLKEVISHASKTEGRMELVSGGSIDLWSLSTTSAESVRGRKYHFVVIDEAGMVVNLHTAWDEVIRPLLVDYRGGALFTSTPKGRNFFYDLYMRGKDPAQLEWDSWNYPSVANPYVHPDEIESARANTVERAFRQEYLAEFVEDAGSVFRNVGPVSYLQPADGPEQAHRLYMGVDWGRDVDFTAISIFDATTNQQVHVERFNQIGWSLQRGRIRALYDKWKPVVILAEKNSIGDPNIEALQQEGLPVQPFVTTSASKPALIERLALAIERADIALIKDDYQMHELRAYTMERVGSHYLYGAPPGGHDDTVIALALSLWAAVANPMVIMRRGGLAAPR
jgi:hypothetical protein